MVFLYIVRRYDEEGEIINYTGDGPTLLYIKKINGQWKVIDVEEPA